jgi:hypothetical protein
MATLVLEKGTVLPERIAHDHYPTPKLFVEKGLLLVERAVTDERYPGPPPSPYASLFSPRILDPGAGEGVWGASARALWTPGEVVGVELRDTPRPEAYDRWHLGDFLQMSDLSPLSGTGYDLVIGNPPYKHAEAFVRKSLDLTREGGVVCFLFYLTFLESQRRGDGLFAEHPPFTVAVSKSRPKFTGPQNPNAACFVLWVKGYDGPTQLEWI